jgi:ankyrin repeat protein
LGFVEYEEYHVYYLIWCVFVLCSNWSDTTIVGDEFYEASVKKANDDGTYSLEYKEHGLIWGEYENCPRDHIRLAGSTVGGETALILAAENNAIEVLRALLEAGASVDLARTNGDSALIAASSHDFVDCVKLLLSHGAKAETRNNAGDTAYILAAGSGASNSLGVLLEVPGAVRYAELTNMGGVCAVEAAARGNHLKCLDKLLVVGVSPDTRNKDGDSPIMITARFDTHLACSKVSSPPSLPRVYVCSQSLQFNVKRIVINLRYTFAINLSSFSHQQRLLAAGCNLEFENNVNGDDVLKLAARFGNTKLVLLLADGDMAPPSRVIPDHRNSNGDTALMLAVANVSDKLYSLFFGSANT